MKKEIAILVADDDEGHSLLIRKNLQLAGLTNEILHFKDGQEILDFLFRLGAGPHRQKGASYVLLLDIRMPRHSGIEVLTLLKADEELCTMPVVILTTTNSPEEVQRCHTLGCSSYIAKTIDYAKFVNAIRQLGLFLTVVEVPSLQS